MPSDNPDPIAAGADIAFPQDGVASAAITRVDDTTFSVSEIGTYLIYFQLPITQSGQVELTLNGAPLPYTVVGVSDEGSQLTGTALVNTTVATSVFTLRNPEGNSPLTLTPSAGGTQPATAHLVILQIA